MAQSKQMRLLLQVFGLLVFAAVLVVLVLDTVMTQKAREFFFNLGGVLTLVLILGAPLVVPRLGSFDGTYFHFPNKTFQERFAALNPRLVRRR